jgi:hypothetical protein
MSHARALKRVQRFLSAMTLALFLGTIAELLSVKHYGEPIKLVPFALCLLGCAALAAVRLRPGRRVFLAVRAFMAVTMLGSLLGVYEHIEGNLETSREIHRHLATMARIKAMLTGRDPIAAPGMLAVAALLLIAATYVAETLARPDAGEPSHAAPASPPTPLRAWRSA